MDELKDRTIVFHRFDDVNLSLIRQYRVLLYRQIIPRAVKRFEIIIGIFDECELL